MVPKDVLGVCEVGSPFGQTQRVFSVGDTSAAWESSYTFDVLSDPNAFATRVGLRNVWYSDDPPVKEVSGTKFLVVCHEGRKLSEMSNSVDLVWRGRGWKASRSTGVTYWYTHTCLNCMFIHLHAYIS